MIQYCFLICNYLSADLIPDTDLYNFHLSYLFNFLLDFLLFYMGLGVSIPLSFSLYSRFVRLFSHRASPYAKVCGSLLPQDFSLCQVLWVSSFTGLYLPMPSFVGFFFHRTLSPNAKVCGFLLPQDFSLR